MYKNTKNSEVGNDCYIIAPGPSINKQDLTLLNGKNVMTISNLYRHDIYKSIPIKYHLLNRQVIHITMGHNTEEQLVGNLKYLETRLEKDTTIIADIADKKLFEKYGLFEKTKIIWRGYTPWNRSKILELDINNMPETRLLMESAIYVAMYMGFENIFILGMDMDYLSNGTESFYNTKKALGKMECLGEKKIRKIRNWDAEFHLNRLNYTILKFKALYDYQENIYNLNANQDTYVDTFPLIRYESLVLQNDKKDFFIKQAKDEFVKIPPIYTKQAFSSFFSFSYEKILSFAKDNKKYIIYGNGSFGKTINKLMDNKALGFIDKNTNDISYPYDYIIISVLGRELEIEEYLTTKLGVDKEKIIIF